LERIACSMGRPGVRGGATSRREDDATARDDRGAVSTRQR
jgi:hypothetical protein